MVRAHRLDFLSSEVEYARRVADLAFGKPRIAAGAFSFGAHAPREAGIRAFLLPLLRQYRYSSARAPARRGQDNQPGGQLPMRYIDCFNHFFPDALWQKMLSTPGASADIGARMRGIPAIYDLDRRKQVCDMFRGKYDYTQVISLGMPPLEALGEPVAHLRPQAMHEGQRLRGQRVGRPRFGRRRRGASRRTRARARSARKAWGCASTGRPS